MNSPVWQYFASYDVFEEVLGYDFDEDEGITEEQLKEVLEEDGCSVNLTDNYFTSIEQKMEITLIRQNQ